MDGNGNRAPRGSRRDEESLDKIVKRFELAKSKGMIPPSLQELSKALNMPYTSTRDAVMLLVRQGRLVKIKGVHRGVRLP